MFTTTPAPRSSTDGLFCMEALLINDRINAFFEKILHHLHVASGFGFRHVEAIINTTNGGGLIKNLIGSSDISFSLSLSWSDCQIHYDLSYHGINTLIVSPSLTIQKIDLALAEQ